MKKFISILSILFFAVTAVNAANVQYKKKKNGGAGVDKVGVKFGPMKYTSKQALVASYLGGNVQISAGGSKGTTSGFFTIYLEPSEIAQLAKGLELDVAGTGDDFTNDNAVTIIFQGTKTKIKGFSTSTVGYTSLNETEATGKFKVLSYDSTTKKLKFSLVAKATPYNLAKAPFKGNSTSKDITKPLPIKVAGTVTLP